MDLTPALPWGGALALLSRLGGGGGGGKLVRGPREQVVLQLRGVAVEQLKARVADDLQGGREASRSGRTRGRVRAGARVCV